MSGPTYPGGYPPNPGDPNSQPGYPSYPQPPQQPYAQPPAYQPPYQQPYQQPYAQPPKKSNRVWIILGVVAVVLIVACIGLCSALAIGGKILGTAISTNAPQLETQASSVEATFIVTTFCQDESNQDYSSAYSQLSPSLKQQYSQSQFTQDGQHHDTTLGAISACAPAGAVTFNGSTASVNVTVTRTPTSSTGTPPASQTNTVSGQITMVQNSDGTWAINSVSSSLNML